ncbi:Asp-tRNA(Asn)/Glu-tRNA(Gln) amidotransferase GatCAB subunit C [Candidatus Parcubacteria bacterium]|nr:MAG: Asp-tRNA(Asn)/Glu-tRNA(Gln) amidotransferase GatCAB subunit C [Candidatus Parcubacteria bacterium]
MIDVEKLAKLARININSEEKQKLQKDFEAILGYISALNEADTSNIEIKEDTNKNVMREDGSAHEAGSHAEKLLNSSLLREDDYIKVKHVFE